MNRIEKLVRSQKFSMTDKIFYFNKWGVVEELPYHFFKYGERNEKESPFILIAKDNAERNMKLALISKYSLDWDSFSTKINYIIKSKAERLKRKHGYE